MVVFGITTLPVRCGSFLTTGRTVGFMETSVLGSTWPFFTAGLGAGASGLATGFAGALGAGLLDAFEGGLEACA